MCFDMNKRGEEGTNCGRNKFGYKRCTASYVPSAFTLNVLLKLGVYHKMPLKETCLRLVFMYVNVNFCLCRNLRCGSIFCGGEGESITGKRVSYTVYGIECKLAVDDDKTRNMDMVPEGTTCGPNKVKHSAGRHITWRFVSYVCFAQNQTFVPRFALTTHVWMYQFMERGRIVQRNATTMG